MKITFYILSIILGALLFVYGGYGDSPGAQFLGLVVFLIGVFKIFRNLRKKDERIH